MRSVGELSRTAPSLTRHDHAVTVGAGAADFARLAADLVVNTPDQEQIALVVDSDPRAWDPAEVFAAEIAAGRLAVFSVSEAYAPMLAGVPDAGRRQLAVFDHVVESARAAGYQGLRVLADNTALVRTVDGGLAAWLAWEQLTDAWQAQRPVTSVCWFDGQWVQPADVDAIRRRHPVSLGGAAPAWRVFTDAEDGVPTVCVAGEVDAADTTDFGAAVATAAAVFAEQPPAGGAGAELVLDVRRARYLDHRALWAISPAALEPAAPRIRLRGASPIVQRLREVLADSLVVDLA